VFRIGKKANAVRPHLRSTATAPPPPLSATAPPPPLSATAPPPPPSATAPPVGAVVPAAATTANGGGSVEAAVEAAAAAAAAARWTALVNDAHAPAGAHSDAFIERLLHWWCRELPGGTLLLDARRWWRKVRLPSKRRYCQLHARRQLSLGPLHARCVHTAGRARATWGRARGGRDRATGADLFEAVAAAAVGDRWHLCGRK